MFPRPHCMASTWEGNLGWAKIPQVEFRLLQEPQGCLTQTPPLWRPSGSPRRPLREYQAPPGAPRAGRSHDKRGLWPGHHSVLQRKQNAQRLSSGFKPGVLARAQTANPKPGSKTNSPRAVGLTCGSWQLPRPLDCPLTQAHPVTDPCVPVTL